MFEPAPVLNWSNLGYFRDQGACEIVAVNIKNMKVPSVPLVVCVPLETPVEKKL